MKRLFFVFALVLAFQIMPAKRVFVEMEYNKNSIKIDYGTDKKVEKLKGDDGKDLKFISLIGALNYMSLLGWELIGATSSSSSSVGIIVGGVVASSSDAKTYFIFSKEVPDEELQEIVDNSYKK